MSSRNIAVVVAWQQLVTPIPRRWVTSGIQFRRANSFNNPSRSFVLGPTCTSISRHQYPTSCQVRRAQLGPRFVHAGGDGDHDDDDDDQGLPMMTMENLYAPWTLEDDQVLWENRHESIVELAQRLGRGLRGITARLAKLQNVNTPAYQRLFAAGNSYNKNNDESLASSLQKKKLVPVSEVLRRIQWDSTLNSQDFSILHYDRVDDVVVESPLDAPNDSIKGSQTKLIDALPEHRIVAVKYKEQVVWDRPTKLDNVFAGQGIQNIISNYDNWKREKTATIARLKQRQEQANSQLLRIFGMELFQQFQQLTLALEEQFQDPTQSPKIQAENYVAQCLVLFQRVRKDPTSSLEPSEIPPTDIMALECLSESMALKQNQKMGQFVLQEIDLTLQRLEGDLQLQKSVATDANKVNLPDLDENDITETFVRGSGPGGQKINKTNNKVVLLHNPTQLRVECQDTRSLQQNRKIARKRLQLKLDEFLNGKQSRNAIKAEKAANKKAKAKARSRARNRKKAADASEESE